MTSTLLSLAPPYQGLLRLRHTLLEPSKPIAILDLHRPKTNNYNKLDNLFPEVSVTVSWTGAAYVILYKRIYHDVPLGR